MSALQGSNIGDSTIGNMGSLDNTITNILSKDLRLFSECNVDFVDYSAVFCDTLAGLSTQCSDTPERLCYNDCKTLQNKYKQISEANCTASAIASQRAFEMDAYCAGLSNTTSNCISLEGNRIGNCGYVSANDICTKCSTANSQFCANIGSSNPLQSNNLTYKILVLVGIILGALLLMLLIVGPIYVKMKKKKRRNCRSSFDGISLISDSSTIPSIKSTPPPNTYDRNRISAIFGNHKSRIWDH